MRVQQTVSTSFGPFFGIEGYDADISPCLLGSLGVDASTGEVLYQAAGSGAFTVASIAPLAFNQWNHFRLVFDFGGASPDTYRGYVNGTAVTPSTGFVDGSFGLDQFTDADISTLAVGPGAPYDSLAGTAYFDNLLVRDGVLGDYDIDGDVDTNDYVRWRATFGNTISPAGNLADGNANAKVDAADYVVWRRNSGANLSSATTLAAASIPEPGSLLLSFSTFAITWLADRRRR
jgi:hypothetical protein